MAKIIEVDAYDMWGYTKNYKTFVFDSLDFLEMFFYQLTQSYKEEGQTRERSTIYLRDKGVMPGEDDDILFA